MTDNLKLWNAHRTPHKDALKDFRKRGGFSGTAIDPMWAIRAATEEWGPMGTGWGYEVVDETVRTLSEEWVLHTVNIKLGYDGGPGGVPSTGSTWLVQPKKDGTLIYDDEAPKKSRTDAIGKALSWLGFGADIYMGMHDGSKYADLDTDNKPQSSDNKPSSNKSEAAFDESILVDTVKANIGAAIKAIGEEEYKQWHDRVLSNFYGVDSISNLNHTQLQDFADKQRVKISESGE